MRNISNQDMFEEGVDLYTLVYNKEGNVITYTFPLNGVVVLKQLENIFLNEKTSYLCMVEKDKRGKTVSYSKMKKISTGYRQKVCNMKLKETYYIYYNFEGKKHNINGPAITKKGEYRYFIDGKEYTEAQYKILIFSLCNHERVGSGFPQYLCDDLLWKIYSFL